MASGTADDAALPGTAFVAIRNGLETRVRLPETTLGGRGHRPLDRASDGDVAKPADAAAAAEKARTRHARHFIEVSEDMRIALKLIAEERLGRAESRYLLLDRTKEQQTVPGASDFDACFAAQRDGDRACRDAAGL